MFQVVSLLLFKDKIKLLKITENKLMKFWWSANLLISWLDKQSWKMKEVTENWYPGIVKHHRQSPVGIIDSWTIYRPFN